MSYGDASGVSVTPQGNNRTEQCCLQKKHKVDRSLGDFGFREGMENYVQLQYPQPFLSSQRNGTGVISEHNAVSLVKRKIAQGSRSSLHKENEFTPEVVLDVK